MNMFIYNLWFFQMYTLHVYSKIYILDYWLLFNWKFSPQYPPDIGNDSIEVILLKAMRTLLIFSLTNVLLIHTLTTQGLHRSRQISKANWLLPNNGKPKVLKNMRIMLMAVRKCFFHRLNAGLLSLLLCNFN